jgi:hypothetical protein
MCGNILSEKHLFILHHGTIGWARVECVSQQCLLRGATQPSGSGFFSFFQGWEVQWISITQTLQLEPIFYFFGGQTLNLKPITFYLEVRTLNLEPIIFFLNGQTLNLGPFAAKTCKPWDLEPQTLNLNMRDFPGLPLTMNMNDCRAE